MARLEGYKGNPLLKKIGQKVDWTPERLREYAKCKEDPIYFTENYIKIIHIDRGLIGFKLYDWQREMMLAMKEERFSAFVVARQGGKSITVASFLLWYVLFHRRKDVGLLANKGDTAREILGRIQGIYQHLPHFIQQGVSEWNKGSMVLENESRIVGMATSSDAARGFSFSIVYLDEVAHVENYDDFFTSVFPTVGSSNKAKVIQTSTPFGLNHFYKTIEGGKRKHDDPAYNGYYVMEVPWYKIPGRDEAWKQKMLEGMNFDTEKFEQEQNIQFLGSSGTLIAGWKLKELTFLEPISKTDAGLKLYQKPIEEHQYVIICDVSRGKGLDYSAFQVIDITQMPYNQVCTFRNNIMTPYDYASVIHNTAKFFNKAYVLVEINDIGEQVGNSLLMEFDYENVLMTVNQGCAGKKLVAGFGDPKSDKGVRTTKLVKNVGCHMLKYLVEGNHLMINDFNTIEELSRFSKKRMSYEAEPGSTDDLTMGLVLFAWMTNQELFKDLTDINTLDKLRETDEQSVIDDLMPMGWVVDGVHDEEVIVEQNWCWREVKEPDPTW